MDRTKHGFTLIELLVVITIIVVLLAMLAPALERAIYQAQLAVCAANLDGISSGVLTYAMSFKRSYPHRPGALDAEYWKPGLIYDPGLTPVGATTYDDRPALRGFIAINKSLNCPLGAPVDYDNSNSILDTGYHLWFGFRYYGQQGMLRVGDRFTYTTATTPPVTYSFDFLATDRDVIDPAAYVLGSHPDGAEVMYNEVAQDQEVKNDTLKKKFTLSRWINYENPARGTIDMNFARADGSTQRLTGVGLPGDEERMVPLSEFTREHYPAARTYLPEH